MIEIRMKIAKFMIGGWVRQNAFIHYLFIYSSHTEYAFYESLIFTKRFLAAYKR